MGSLAANDQLRERVLRARSRVAADLVALRIDVIVVTDTPGPARAFVPCLFSFDSGLMRHLPWAEAKMDMASGFYCLAFALGVWTGYGDGLADWGLINPAGN